MHLSVVRKQADFSITHTRNNLLIFTVCSFFVTLINGIIHGLHITETIHQQYNRHSFCFFFFVYSCFSVFNHSQSRMGKFFFQCFQLFDNDFCHYRTASKNFLIQCNIFQCFLMFCHQCFNFQSDQLVQTHFQNGCCLSL